jgi:hypothetical protein
MARDSSRGRRNNRGSGNPKARLTDSQVLDIRARFQHGMKHELATEYGVGGEMIVGIVTGKYWKHLGGQIIAPQKKWPVSDIAKAKMSLAKRGVPWTPEHHEAVRKYKEARG